MTEENTPETAVVIQNKRKTHKYIWKYNNDVIMKMLIRKRKKKRIYKTVQLKNTNNVFANSHGSMAETLPNEKINLQTKQNKKKGTHLIFL